MERSVPTVRDDCFGGERLVDLDAARERGRRWALEEYGTRRHARTQQTPLALFEQVERPALLPSPTAPYDVPTWASPTVARDQLAQVVRALYSIPHRYVWHKLVARADAQLVRFYERGVLIKTHPRQRPGGRSIDPHDYPAERSVYALRNVDALQTRAAQHGPHIARYAALLLDGPLPWTRMRRVYGLLGLVRRFGPSRVEAACALALAVDCSTSAGSSACWNSDTSRPPRRRRPASFRSPVISDPPTSTPCRSPPRRRKESPHDHGPD